MSNAIRAHWLTSAESILSPNHNERPQADRVDLLVVHNISLPPREFGGPYIPDFFTNNLDHNAHPYFQEIKELKVSAHLLIRRDGSVIQFVPFDKRAWHAGQSCFQEEENCNDYSIGIELEGCDDIEFSLEQYQSLARITKQLMKAYNGITEERIVGHSDIAPGRKTDPGEAFDWSLYRRLISSKITDG